MNGGKLPPRQTCFPSVPQASTEPPFMNGGKTGVPRDPARPRPGFNGAAVHERRKAHYDKPVTPWHLASTEPPFMNGGKGIILLLKVFRR